MPPTALIKIGGSVLQSRRQEIGHVLSGLRGSCVVVIGFGPRLRRLMETDGRTRRTFVSGSGVESHFSDEYVVGVSHHAAALELRLLSEEIERRVHPHCAVMGSNGLLRGTRKRIRYWDDGVLRLSTTDRSGTDVEVDVECLGALVREHALVVVAPMLVDREDGAPLVCDADTAAAAIAVQMGINSVVFVSDTPGLIRDGELIDFATLDDIADLLDFVSGGMTKKLIQIRNLLSAGVEDVLLGDVEALAGHGSRFHVG